MITPSTIAKKVSAQPLPSSEYNFPEQVREGEGKTPLIAAWSMNSMQTYDWNGRPNDAKSDNWD